MRTSQNGNVRSYEPLGSSPNTQRSFMDYSWHIFTCFGIPVYIHMLLPLFFILSFVFWARIIVDDSSHIGYYILLIILENAVLWVTVLVHELGHCFAGYLVGGTSEKILLWPLGGLAFTQPPLNHTKKSEIIIALGGPLTHIPMCIFWGSLLVWNATRHPGYSTLHPLSSQLTWNQTIYVPIDEFIDYDFFMLSFTMNFWLLIVNLLLPAYPLDGSRVFTNLLRMKYTTRKTAEIYVVVNAVLGVAFILVAYLWLKSGSMCQFAGLWGVYQCHVMVQLLIQGREFSHPLLMS